MFLSNMLITASSTIILVLGTLHLVYTFWGPKLTPRDPALRTSMQQVSMVLTKETTMWKAWIGFNASHSLGAMLFGLVYGYLALMHPAFLFQSYFLLAVGFALLASLAVLGKVYWFSIPFTGIWIALSLYFGGVLASFMFPHTFN